MGKQKKVWSELQDQLLKKYYEQQKMRNWSLIAKKMFEQNHTPKKSGKQCRQRYQNHIDTSVIKIQWTRQQQKDLIRLHDEIGNKWALIALKLPGKSDNCVKNHFYSKLRKMLRKLNRLIHLYFRRQFRQININVIYKLVEATQQKFKDKSSCNQSVSLKCRAIQNKLLDAQIGDEQADVEVDEDSLKMYKAMIKQIYQASRQYKRKSKKSRNLSIQAPNIRRSKQCSTVLVKGKASSDGYMSDSQNQNNQDVESDQSYPRVARGAFIVNQQQKPDPKKVQVEQGRQGIQNLLRLNNVLENQFSDKNERAGSVFKFSDKSSFRSFNNSDRQSDKDYYNMFESSDMQMGTRRKNSNIYISNQVMIIKVQVSHKNNELSIDFNLFLNFSIFKIITIKNKTNLKITVSFLFEQIFIKKVVNIVNICTMYIL